MKTVSEYIEMVTYDIKTLEDKIRDLQNHLYWLDKRRKYLEENAPKLQESLDLVVTLIMKDWDDKSYTTIDGPLWEGLSGGQRAMIVHPHLEKVMGDSLPDLKALEDILD